MNRIQCKILRDDLEFGDALQWVNVWDTVGVLGLGTADLQKLQAFGDFVEGTIIGNTVFGMVPKEIVIEETAELSAILKNDLRDFELDSFPKELLRKNGGLGGSLVITHSKVYGPVDKTRKGQSKDGWKLLFLEGCATFLSRLSNYPESYRFEFGSSRLQIWGGERKEEPVSYTHLTLPTIYSV